MRDHAMLRPGAHAFKMPKAHQGFRWSRCKQSAYRRAARRRDFSLVRPSVDSRAEMPPGRKARPGAFDHLPRFGQIENDSIDVVLSEIGGDIAEFHRPVRRRPEISRHIFLRQARQSPRGFRRRSIGPYRRSRARAPCSGRRRRRRPRRRARRGKDRPRSGSVRCLWDKSLERCAAGWE